MYQAGDIIFSTDEEPISVLIRHHTHSPVSHVGIFVDETHIVSARAQGVVTDTIEAWTPTYWVMEIYSKNTPLTCAEIKRRMVDFMLSQSGDGYDFLGLLDFLTNRNLAVAGQWFCSELVTAAIISAGIPIFGGRREPAFTSPGDLFSNPLLVEVK
jgi:uncharacterized protein YycO